MADENVGNEYSRNPTVDDLVLICKHLNDAGALYVVVGGFAMIHHKMLRGTVDIDLLVEPSEQNMVAVKKGLECLPDRAVRQVDPKELLQYTVIRVADEVLVDLMGRACDVTYNDVRDDIEFETIDGVRIPYLNAKAMLKTKQTLRAQDELDRLYLQSLLQSQKSK